MGAGRINKEDKIENEVGITFHKKIGDKVDAGQTLAIIYSNNKEKAENAVEKLKKAYEVIYERIRKPKVILGIVEDNETF